MNVPVKQDAGAIAEAVIVKGDLSKLTPQERGRFYVETCRSLRLNPLTRPFSYIVLNGQLTLYANKGCTDQLRAVNEISIEIVEQKMTADGLYEVHARAHDKHDRMDEDFGIVDIADTVKGEARANLKLKAVTKAKRRVTLSICGLGFLDETEVADIPPHAKKAANDFNDEIPDFADQVVETAKQDADPGTSPHAPTAPVPGSAHIQSAEAHMAIEDMAREAAQRGEEVFRQFYKGRTAKEKEAINKIGDELRNLMAGG